MTIGKYLFGKRRNHH